MENLSNPISELWETTTLFGNAYTDYAKKFNIHYNELACFYSLYKEGSCTQKHICQEWLLPKQTVNTLCKALMDKGYIETVAHDGDQREKRLILTAEGRAAAAAMVVPLLAAENKAVEAFSAARTAALVNEFRALQQLFADILNLENQGE